MKLFYLLSLLSVFYSDVKVTVLPHTKVPDKEIHVYEKPDPIEPHECISAWYQSQTHVRELTGKNDGKEVENYLRHTKLGKGNPWCAAFVRTGFDTCGVKTSITAWSPTAHNDKNLVYFKGKKHKAVEPGKDVFTIYYASKKRIGHTGFAHKTFSETVTETVEGNTAPSGTREGHGVYRMKRQTKSLYSITRWE